MALINLKKIQDIIKNIGISPRKGKKTIKKVLAVLAVGSVFSGSVLITDTKLQADFCNITMQDVSWDNIYDKMIEQINVYEPKEDKIQMGCKLEKVNVKNGIIKTESAIQFTENGCKDIAKKDYDLLKTKTFIDIKKQDKLELNEMINTRKNFADLWHRALFEKCGVIEKKKVIIK